MGFDLGGAWLRTRLAAGALGACLAAWGGGSALAQSGDAADCAPTPGVLDRVHVSFDTQTELAAGDPIDVTIQNALQHDVRESRIWLVLVMVENVRFSGTGFLVYPPNIEGPLGIGFAQDWMRVFIPLHDARVRGAIKLQVKPYREAPFRFSWAIVEQSAGCDERLLSDVAASPRYEVSAGTPQIVLQDLYDYREPEFTLTSSNQRYEIAVFENHFQVFNRETGEKVLDRRGACPDFSPTGRFVAALSAKFNMAELGHDDEDQCVFNTSGASLPKLEIYDLFTGDLVTRAHPPVLWAHGDSHLYVPAKWWKMLQGPGYLQSLIKDPQGSAEPFQCAFSDDMSPAFDWVQGIALDAPEEYVGTLIMERAPNYFQLKREYLNYCDFLTNTPELESSPEVREVFLSARPRSAPPVGLAGSHGHYTPNLEETYGHAQYFDEIENGFESSRKSEAGDLAFGADATDRARMIASAVSARAAGDGAAELGPLLARLGLLLDTWFPTPAPLEQRSIDRESVRLNSLGLSEEDEQAQLSAYQDASRKFAAQFLRGSPQAAVLDQSVDCWPSGSILGDNLTQVWTGRVGAAEMMLTQSQCMAMGTVGGLTINSLDLYLKQGSETKHSRLVFAGLEDERVADGSRFSKRPLFGSGPRFQIDDTTIQYRQMRSSLHEGRFLLVSLQDILLVSDLKDGRALGPISLDFDSTNSEFSVLEKAGVVAQIDRERIAFYSMADGSVILRGRIVDDEIIVYDQWGYFTSSVEGASFVHVQFSGRADRYSLGQFDAILRRPELVKAVLQQGRAQDADPRLSPPPRAQATFDPEASEAALAATFALNVTSETALDRAEIYVDGARRQTVDLTGLTPTDGVYETAVSVAFSRDAAWLAFELIDADGKHSIPVVRQVDAELRAFADDAPSRLHLIAAGVDTYRNAAFLPALNFAARDARTFLDAFGAAGARSFDETVVAAALLDARDVGARLTNAIAQTAQRATENDLTVVHLAGHGVKDASGAFYLATYETDPADIAGTSLAWSEISAALSQIPGRVLVLIDACHSGASQAVTNDDVVDALLASSERSIAVIAASKGRQVSLETSAFQGGVFTTFLTGIVAGEIDGVDVNRNGSLELSELYLHLKSEVVVYTEGAQTPWIARNDMVGEAPLFALAR